MRSDVPGDGSPFCFFLSDKRRCGLRRKALHRAHHKRAAALREMSAEHPGEMSDLFDADRILKAKGNVTIETLLRAAALVGRELRLELV